ncbi:SAM-dependent methyltransferase [Streptomyces laculatispora]|uniref:SAM-dependent methyltransferase n=1 Tax=Streptomyces laculatispora TaxID=887464 RepID=UPI001A948B89|nr:SAM-dependent methyltransferase [Streptomyces laculatispora]MBO0916313.1 SAM-dependent methyltransferase [Streptomyces laculatispora]
MWCEAARTLDLDRPVAVAVLSALGRVADSAEAAAPLRNCLDASPAGSCPMPCDTIETPETQAGSEGARQWGRCAVRLAAKKIMATFADGLDLVEPGFGPISQTDTEVARRRDVPRGHHHSAITTRPGAALAHGHS